VRLQRAEERLGWEVTALAAFAEKAAGTRGRRHPEAEHPFKTPFERDRDRVVHSRAFRRLEATTQVFVKQPGQSYRSRLTHTLEVSQIARSIARTLCLNEDLTESIALAHDVGHPPFGHAGERTLTHLLAAEGGFNHNWQSLRILECLESRYREFPGLNLTWEVREGLAKHGSGRGAGRGEYGPGKQPSLEAQVVDLADEIAYNAHDVDDGLSSGLITAETACAVPLWCRLWEAAEGDDPSVRAAAAIRALIDSQVRDLLEATAERLDSVDPQTPDEVRWCPRPLVGFSAKMGEENQLLRRFLFRRLYRHPEVVVVHHRADQVLRSLFHSYLTGRLELPPPPPGAEGSSSERLIADHLAAMTDTQALLLFENLPWLHTPD
jgi:dGTPase